MEHALLNDESEWSLASDRAPFWVGKKKKAAWNFVCSSTQFQWICNYSRLVEILGFSWISRSEGLDR